MSKLPELSHWLNQPEDRLAAQFDAILNLNQTFLPLLEIASLSFLARLDQSLADVFGATSTFQRNSSAVVRHSNGQYQEVSQDIPRFENNALLLETSKTNKCENWNANPDEALTGVVPNGLTAYRTFNPASIAAAGLANICDGYVIEFENNSGATQYPYVVGNSQNTQPHHASCWMDTFGQTIGFGCNEPGLRADFNTNGLERVDIACAPLNSISTHLEWAVPNNAKCQFVLNQWEQSTFLTSPIITRGDATSRQGDTLFYSDASNFFNQEQGMALITWRPRVKKGIQTSQPGDALLSITKARDNLIFYDSDNFKSYDNTSLLTLGLPAFVENDELKIAVIFGPAVDNRQIGYSRNSNPWVWSTPGAYDGAFLTDDNLYVAHATLATATIHNVAIYKENHGSAWVEANY